ncbi:isoprenylcysteine carboxyl methyltransferase [Cordyceps militaris]|uniref:Protein-S-isoprenylcysteine O-methyltransferase n=1 Tax=Cordyceps militaris TaxID=73501 RepID=A0A2H4SMQ9_CORMI|nr:isoprenylcysteine carboxyl methyltransferase [Cordyceps militaris]
MDADLSSPQQLSFFAALLVAGYLTVRVIVPPNRTPRDERAWRADALWFARSAFIINLAILSSSALILYHAALTALPPAAAARVCPAPGQPNPALFRWSPVTAAAFLAVLAGAPLRMGAFSGLGKNFTFGLARPSGLVTTGIYAQVQHPSYTGMWLVAVASFAVFVRPDGALACFVPPVYWPRVQAWAATLMVGAGLLVAQQIATRVAQEEAMLKELFGKEWEAWHAKTKRFVPGLF